MLEALQNIADDLGLNFTAGRSSDLNALADSHAEGFLLFYEGYFRADQFQTMPGHLRYVHKVNYILLLPSKPTDTVQDKIANKRLLKPMNEAIMARLFRLGIASNMSVNMDFTLNKTDRNMDGFAQSLLLATPAVSLC